MGLTETMRRELDELGFTVLEGLLRGPELQRVAASVRAVAEHGDSGVVAPIALEMMAHEPVMPYLVDAMGYNIHMRDGLFACYPPNTNPVDFGRLGTGWHIDQQEEFRGVTHDGRVPLVELKVSFFLSDASASGHAATCLVPGSHLWTPQQRATWNPATVPVVPLRVPAGTVLLWRSTLLHSVTPHQSPEWRLHLMFSYVPRWFRPSYRGTFANIVADPSLLERCDPVRRQLLGAMGDLTDDGLPLNSPLYLFPTDDAHVPLKAWAEERGLISREQHILGTQGFGASNSRKLNGIGPDNAEQGVPAFGPGLKSKTHDGFYRAAAWRDVPRRALLEAEVGQLRARLALLERKIASL